MYLAEAFIQSNLQCIQAIHFFYQYVCCLGIEPTTFCDANTMLYHWTTGIQPSSSSSLVQSHRYFGVLCTVIHYYCISIWILLICVVCVATLYHVREKRKKKIDAPSLLSTLHYPVWDHKEMEQWCSFFRMVDVWRTALRSFWRTVILLAVMRSVWWRDFVTGWTKTFGSSCPG